MKENVRLIYVQIQGKQVILIFYLSNYIYVCYLIFVFKYLFSILKICVNVIRVNDLCLSSRVYNVDLEYRNNELFLQSYMQLQYGKCEIGFFIIFNLCVVKIRFCMVYEYS